MKRLKLYVILLIISICGGLLLYRNMGGQKTEAVFIPKKRNTRVDLRPLPGNFYSYGIDVSRYQEKIDWQVVSNSMGDSLSFVYFKVSEGISLIDPMWETNYEAARSLAIPNGAYHFYIPGVDPQKQAEHFLANYLPGRGDLPPVLDVELEIRRDKSFLANIRIWLNAVEKKSGKRPIIYTSYHLFERKLKHAFPTYYFWVANYSDREERFRDSMIVIWQYTDQGIVPGIQGFTDLNFCRSKLFDL